MIIKKTIMALMAGIFLMASGLLAQFPDARRPGEEVLYEALLGARGFLIVAESNGCTQKESFQVDSLKKKNQDGSAHYVFTVRRIRPDECKRMPERVIISFDIEKDLGIKGQFTYELTNRIFPARAEEGSLYSIIEKYFSIGKESLQREETTAPVRVEPRLAAVLKEELNNLSLAIRSELRKAMIFSIESEIARYRQRGDQARISELNEQLKKFQAMSDSEFPLPPEEPEASGQSLLTPSGPIIPPQVTEAQVVVSGTLKPGALLEVAGMTKSGPFYHLAGSRGDILNRLKPGQKYTATLCLLYKREYFGQIPNYYVYLAGIKH
ncbi:MAG: hypothetical protein N3G18_10575 [Candidatus Saccharicenans sp.]|nr:hypothetical protein [Candidatus Saccharicenans sp.]